LGESSIEDYKCLPEHSQVLNLPRIIDQEIVNFDSNDAVQMMSPQILENFNPFVRSLTDGERLKTQGHFTHRGPANDS